MGNYRLRNGTSNKLLWFDTRTNFDLTDSSNDLYKLNSVNGGVIVPRGTFGGMDLRKPRLFLLISRPENDDIERSNFRLTGGCYQQFSIFDVSKWNCI